MRSKIVYNHAIEFVGAIYKYAKYRIHQYGWKEDQLNTEVSKDVLDFSPSLGVKTWLRYIEDHISPFMRNDIMLVMNDVYGLLDVCFELVYRQELKEPQDLIRAFEDLDPIDLSRKLFVYYDLELPFESPENEIMAELESYYPFEICITYINIFKQPHTFKQRLVQLLKDFYEQFFLPFETQVYHSITQKIGDHEALLEENESHFINTIGLGDFQKIMNSDKQILLFISYYIDLGLMYLCIDDTFFIFYGQSIEHRFDAFTKEEKYKAFYKGVSDDKRLEIIKLTSKRPWYAKELADHFGLTTATLSYHLNMLLDLGILTFEPSINNRYYYTTDKENLSRLFDLALKGLLK